MRRSDTRKTSNWDFIASTLCGDASDAASCAQAASRRVFTVSSRGECCIWRTTDRTASSGESLGMPKGTYGSAFDMPDFVLASELSASRPAMAWRRRASVTVISKTWSTSSCFHEIGMTSKKRVSRGCLFCFPPRSSLSKAFWRSEGGPPSLPAPVMVLKDIGHGVEAGSGKHLGSLRATKSNSCASLRVASPSAAKMFGFSLR
eukprot:scaffold2245_cov232-Pinguiococcus_pyrenoidosus.AAC.2